MFGIDIWHMSEYASDLGILFVFIIKNSGRYIAKLSAVFIV